MSHNDDFGILAAFGAMANAMGGGGDRGNLFPASDADDLGKGARFIPGEVTLARRDGAPVKFVQDCSNSTCWYWEFSDGTRSYHWDRFVFHSIAIQNGKWDGTGSEFSGDAGPCPLCGNVNTNGGTVKPARN